MPISIGEVVQPFRRFEQKIASLNASTSVDVPLGCPGRLTDVGRMSLVSATFVGGTADALDDSNNQSIILYKVPVVAGVAGTKVPIAQLHWATTAKTLTHSDATTQSIAGGAVTAFVAREFTITTLEADWTFNEDDVLTYATVLTGAATIVNAVIEVDFIWGRK